MLIEKYWEFILDFLTLTAEVTKSCDEFERVNSRWLILYVLRVTAG